MNKKSLVVGLLGLGALGGLVGTSSAQFISLDGITEPVAVKAKNNDVKLTADFDGASLKEVVQWMRKSNLDFVLEGVEAGTAKTADLKFKDTPGQEVIEAVACAFGLRASREGESYVLSRPEDAWAPEAVVVADEAGQDALAPLQHEIEIELNEEATKDDERQKAMDQAVAEAEKAAQEAEQATDLAAAKAAARRAAHAAKKAAELAKARSFTFTGPGSMRMTAPRAFSFHGMDPEHMKKMERELGALGRVFSFEFGDKDHPMPEELKKHLEELKKSGKGFSFKFDGKNHPMPEELKKHLEEMKKMGKSFAFEFHGEGSPEWTEGRRLRRPGARAPRAMTLGKGMDAKAFLESLTEAQLKTMKERGHLRLSELTDKQRKMLGDPSGKFNITMHVDGKTVKVKGDDAPKPPAAPDPLTTEI